MARTIAALACAWACATGCGSSRVVSQVGNTGTIELQGDHLKAMLDANRKLVAICGDGNASIVKQGDEPVPGGTVTDGSAEVVWRIHFQCGATAASVAAPAPIAAPPPRSE